MPAPLTARTVRIIGAGPTGLALAALLGRDGHTVVVHEARSAASLADFDASLGRRISVDLSARAIRVLTRLGVWAALSEQTTPVTRRCVHTADGGQITLPFVGPDAVIHTTSRAALRAVLLQAVADTPTVTLRHCSPMGVADLAAGRLQLGREEADLHADVVIGCDGVGSSVRALIEADTDTAFTRRALPHHFRPLPLSGLDLPRDAMHLLQHPEAIIAAQPAADGGLSGALISTRAGLAALDVAPVATLRRWFPALADHATALAERLLTAPTLPIAEVRGTRWQAERFDMAIIGDAAHAMSPFLGQGLNAALEDCRLLCEALKDAPSWREALARFTADRLPDIEAIQDLSAENYPELCRPETAAAERRMEARLLQRPGALPYHSRVCFTHQPYREIRAHRDRQVALCRLVVWTQHHNQRATAAPSRPARPGACRWSG